MNNVVLQVLFYPRTDMIEEEIKEKKKVRKGRFVGWGKTLVEMAMGE
jgi:hypothetical protein